MEYMWILAQTQDQGGVPSEPANGQSELTTTAPSGTDAPVDPNAAKTGKPGGFGIQQFIFLGLMFVIMYIILFRGPRKKQQQHKQMVQALSKNDKVRTIGGIIGTVVDIKDDEVTLKIDESNNTKIKIAASAIGRNMTKEG